MKYRSLHPVYGQPLFVAFWTLNQKVKEIKKENPASPELETLEERTLAVWHKMVPESKRKARWNLKKHA